MLSPTPSNSFTILVESLSRRRILEITADERTRCINTLPNAGMIVCIDFLVATMRDITLAERRGLVEVKSSTLRKISPILSPSICFQRRRKAYSKKDTTVQVADTVNITNTNPFTTGP